MAGSWSACLESVETCWVCSATVCWGQAYLEQGDLAPKDVIPRLAAHRHRMVDHRHHPAAKRPLRFESAIQKDVDGEDVIAEVCAIFRHIDLLVEVADFCAPPAGESWLASNSHKDTILVVTGSSTPISVVEMEKYFIPGDP
jgi:hypothetical protein